MIARTVLAATLALLTPGLALADGEPVATADASAPVPAPSSDEPITLGDSAAPPPPAPEPKADRKLHGEVGIAAGTGGYRSGYLILEAPLGERGQVGIAVGASRSNRGYPGAYRPNGPDTLGPYRPDQPCEVIGRDGAPPPPDSTPLCAAPGGEP